MTARMKGFAAVMLSAVFFGTMPLFAKYICANGGNVMCVAFYRFLIAIFPLYAWLKFQRISFSITRKELRQIALLAIVGYALTALLIYISYEFIPSGIATTVHFVYPAFVILGSILFLKERPQVLKLLCVALCMGGIFLLYGGEGEINGIGLLIAFISGATYAFYIIYLDKSGLQRMPTLKLIFYMNLLAAPVLFVGTLLLGRLTVSLTPSGWLVMLLLSIGASFIGVSLFQKGAAVVGPQNAAILSAFEPITSLVMGILVLHEPFGPSTAVGCLMILTSIVIVAKSEGK